MIPVLFVSGWVLAARQFYARWRPAREPIYCRGKYYGSCNGADKHDSACYHPSGTLTNSSGEAALYGLLAGLLWPLLWLPWLVMFKPHPREEELAATIARLEKELDLR